MQYLIDSYVAYMAEGNIFEKPFEIVNWLFVDVPFFLLRMVASVFLFIEDLANQSSFFEGMRTTVFNMSKNILDGFGGLNQDASHVRIQSSTLFALAITVSAFYLMYHFFFSQRSFLKVFLHYLVVIALFGLWFGNVETNNGKTYTGATFVVNTVSNFVDSIQSKFISGGSLSSSGGSSGENGEGIYQSAIFDATVGQTFNFVNSGSLDGTMENGEKLDKNKLLRKPGLSEEQEEEWKEKNEDYIEKNKDKNPYFEQKVNKTMEKSFAIGVGFVNLFVLAVPLTYINFLLTLVELGANLLILIFPLIVLLSLFPRCQMIMFKFFKTLLGVLFLPALYGIFMSVLLWVNGLIDSLFVNVIGKISGALLLVLSGSVITLGTLIVTVLLKVFVYRKLWKNRYKVLEFFTDGQLKEPSFEKKVSEKLEKVKDRTLELGQGAIETYAGATTGNIGMAVDGMNKIMPEQDKALNLSDSRFEEENGAVEPFDEENEEMPEMEDVLEDGEAFDELEEEQELEDSGLLDEMDAFDEEPEDSALLDETEAFDEISEEVSVEGLDKSLEEMDMPVLDEQEIQLTDDELDVDTLVEDELEAMENAQVDEANIDNLMETESPELIDSMNVTVDNFDELAFAREERAYFDHGGDEELINNYTGSEQSNVVSFYQTEENFHNLEQMEEEFFGSRLSGTEDIDVEEGW